MNNSKGVFERFAEAMQKTGDATLAWYFQKEMMHQSLLDKETRQGLVDEITAKVISNIQVSVDISDVLWEIEKLRKSIYSLGK